MIEEFSAQRVALDVLAHLERRRLDIAFDEAKVRTAVQEALVPIRRAYQDAELPAAYLLALEREIEATVPSRWQTLARSFTSLEQRDFGLWRGGDVVARITYLFAGLAIGGLCVELPFIPIWEKWFPFALAIGAFWLPNLQSFWLRRRYARALGALARDLGSAQKTLEQHVTTRDLLAPGDTTHE
jgi:hypothetical protein